MTTEFFKLRNGQYIMSEYASKRFSSIVDSNPDYNSELRWDEMSMAELFADIYKDDTRYCTEHKCWYTYNGSVWERDLGSLIASERMKEFTRLLHLYAGEIEEEERAKDFKTFTAKLGDRRARDRMLKDACSVYPIRATQFDDNPYLINCKNGTYDLQKMAFRPATAEDFITMQTNFEYTLSKDLKFERWDRFISEIMCDDKELIDFLQRALGYSILGKGSEECMFIAYGATTRNGKGTLFNTLFRMLGDYAKAPQVNMICKGKFDTDISKPNPALCSLQGSRFVTLSEPPENALLDEEAIKNYTGGDPVTTRQLYGEVFTFMPQFKMWLSCNTLPAVSDKTIFSSDRIKLIEFNRHFTESERDTSLKSKLLEPNATKYIFKWLLDGYRKYKKYGLKQPERMKTAVSMYERENDKVASFFEEKCKRDGQAQVTGMALYVAYKNWCKENGFGAKGSTNFYKEFTRFATKVRPNGTIHFNGVTLKTVLGGK